MKEMPMRLVVTYNQVKVSQEDLVAEIKKRLEALFRSRGFDNGTVSYHVPADQPPTGPQQLFIGLPKEDSMTLYLGLCDLVAGKLRGTINVAMEQFFCPDGLN